MLSRFCFASRLLLFCAVFYFVAAIAERKGCGFTPLRSVVGQFQTDVGVAYAAPASAPASSDNIFFFASLIQRSFAYIQESPGWMKMMLICILVLTCFLCGLAAKWNLQDNTPFGVRWFFTVNFVPFYILNFLTIGILISKKLLH